MPGQKSNITDILYENNEHFRKKKMFFIWLPINVLLLSILLRDIWKTQRINNVILFLEHSAAVILSLNILYLCCDRFLTQYFPKNYYLPMGQFMLLKKLNNKIVDGKCNVTVSPEQNNRIQGPESQKIQFEQFRASSSPLFPSTSPMKSNLQSDNDRMDKFPVKRYHAMPSSLFAGTPVLSDSLHDISMHSSVDSYLGLSGTFDSFSNSSVANSSLSKSLTNFFKDDFTDEIDSYRKTGEMVDYKAVHNLDVSGYWKTKDNMLFKSQNIQRPDVILNDVYQLSPTAAMESVKPVNEVSSLGANLSVCKKFGVNQSYLPEWIANLRKWITQTILTRIIKEIKNVNHALTVHGVTNVSIGSSGLERLKKTASMSQVYQNIPSLSSLISFLDISSNQEYVVQRISALSTGSMSNYCWNSGGTYEGKPWNDSLPTDAALVMHLVAAYFDSQLFPLPHAAPDGRQFSSAHYVKTPAIPTKTKKSLIIYQQSINPPHFQLIIDEDSYDISRGRNNLFHVLLFFLQHIKTRESGMFEHVNLGSSGINMLWIINEPNHNIYKKLR